MKWGLKPVHDELDFGIPVKLPLLTVLFGMQRDRILLNRFVDDRDAQEFSILNDVVAHATAVDLSLAMHAALPRRYA
jgi:hypothetical protein